MPSNHLILCHPLLLLPSIFPSIRVFSSELALHIRWPKYWSFSFSISLSNEYSGLISFRIDYFDLLAVQGTLKSSPAPQFGYTLYPRGVVENNSRLGETSLLIPTADITNWPQIFFLLSPVIQHPSCMGASLQTLLTPSLSASPSHGYGAELHAGSSQLHTVQPDRISPQACKMSFFFMSSLGPL